MLVLNCKSIGKGATFTIGAVCQVPTLLQAYYRCTELLWRAAEVPPKARDEREACDAATQTSQERRQNPHRAKRGMHAVCGTHPWRCPNPAGAPDQSYPFR